MPEPISKENAEHYQWGEVCDGWHLLKTPGLSVIQERVPSGAGEIRHLHQQAHQFFFVLSGEAHLQVGEACHVLEQGRGCHVPAGVAHQLSNNGSDPLEFLVISAPMAHGDRVIVEPRTQQGAAANTEKPGG